MSGWLRLDSDFALDGRLRKSRAILWWPLVLSVLKRHGGRAPSVDLDPDVLCDVAQATPDAAKTAMDGLLRVGLLVEADGFFTSPAWDDHQIDPGASRRQAASRASRDVTKTSVTCRDVTDEIGASRNVTPDVTGRDVTGQDKQQHQQPPVAPRADLHLVPHVLANATPTGRGLPELERLALDCYTPTVRKPRPSMLDQQQLAILAELLKAHGFDSVSSALAECGGAERPAYMARSKLNKGPSTARDGPPGEPRDRMLTWDEVVTRAEKGGAT